MFARALTIAFALGLSLGFVTGCEKTDHDSIDKWTRTEKGPGKLRKAVANEELDPDLSAHAAENLFKMGKDAEVHQTLETMSPGRRTQVIGKLAPRLWNAARVEEEKQIPNPPQIAAKDALLSIRKWADEAQKAQIDGYLVDWYAVFSYEARAPLGAHLGANVMRLVGVQAAKKLTSVLNNLIVQPGQEKAKLKIGDELMLGLAATGDPDAVKYLLEVAVMDRGDKTLGKRALRQLYLAYVNPGGLFDIQAPDAIIANLPTLVALAKDDTQPGEVINDAIELIRVTGPANCFEPLVSLIAVPHRTARFKYVAASNALKCGGTKEIVRVIEALPAQGAYDRLDMKGTVFLEIAGMTPPDQVKAALRQLLSSKSTISKWVAVETLAAMKSTEDLSKIQALASNKERLVGFWGEENPENKPDPTLGQRAKELADGLAKGEIPK